MPTINLTIQGKLAVAPCSYIVANNGDYVANVSFDPTWPSDAVKTLRINYNGAIYDSVFSGNEVKLPPLEYSQPFAEIGVFSDGMQTTRPANIPVFPSILTAGGVPAAPDDDVYHQLIALVNASKISDAKIDTDGHLIITTADGSTFDAGYTIGPEGPMAGGTVTSVNGVLPDENGNVEIETVSQEEIGEAVEEYLTENPVEVTETDPTVPAWAKNASMPVATAESVGGVKIGANLEVSADGTVDAKVGFIAINYMRDLPDYIGSYKLILIPTGAVENPTGVDWTGSLLVMQGDFSYGVYSFSAFDEGGAFYRGDVDLRTMTPTMSRITIDIVNITENEDGTYSADKTFFEIVDFIEHFDTTPVACFDGYYYPLFYFDGQQEPVRFHGFYNSVQGGGASVEHEFASIIINPDNSVEVHFESAETPTMELFSNVAQEFGETFIPKPDMSSTPDQLLAVNEVDEDGKPTSWKTVDAPEGGGGIEVTGATVGQTVKIAAVDSNGVPTAWEPVDLPKGEEWKTKTYDFSSESVSSATFELPSKKIKRGKLTITATQTGETSTGKSNWRLYADVVAAGGNAQNLYTSGGVNIYTSQRTATFVWEALTEGFVKVNTIDFNGGTVFEKRYVDHVAQDYLYFVLTTTGAAMTGTATLMYSE